MQANIVPSQDRIVKVPFPIELIRRMDEAIVIERGGFRTRAELMREAVENLLNELEFPEAPMNSLSRAAGSSTIDRLAARDIERPSLVDELASGLPEWEREELMVVDLAATALRLPSVAPEVIDVGATSALGEPMLGLHNRDYVSIWALNRLARYTADGFISMDDYLRRVTRAAWYFGAQLQTLEARTQARKLAVLFPTNTAKQPSAERGFQNFAVGGIGRRAEDGQLLPTGPLFSWHAIQLRVDGDLVVGLTDIGWRLLHDLKGMSLDLPHSPNLTSRFLAYLTEHAPADRWGFDQILRVVAEGPSRETLVASFADIHPKWSASTASSVAQGYIARSREWGLVEPQLVEGRYWPTATGRKYLPDLA